VRLKEKAVMSNRLAFAGLAMACLVAAAAGGYLATRQNAVPTPAAAASAPLATAPAAAPVTTSTAATPSTADKPVQETEGIIGDSAAAKPASPVAPDAKAPDTKSTRRAPVAATPARQTPSRQASASASQPPPLTSTWPSSAQQTPTPSPTPAPESQTHPEERVAQEPPRAPEPPKPTFEELVISRDSVIGLQTDNRISTETARVEDRVDAHVTRDVRVGDHVAIPTGAKVIGTVTQVDRGGRYREQARLGIRFHTIVLADGTRLPISTETIIRDGEAPGKSSAAKIGGGAIGGAILGAILGGGKGAAIGATAGAGAGTAAVQASDRSNVVLQPGTPLTARILSPVTVTVERN
jgi:hypothetical protein